MCVFRSYMFGGNNTTTFGNLTSAQNQNQNQPDEEDDFDIPSADESLLEALRSPPQQAVSKKTKVRLLIFFVFEFLINKNP